jgi:phosphatidate phosphatase APP1
VILVHLNVRKDSLIPNHISEVERTAVVTSESHSASARRLSTHSSRRKLKMSVSVQEVSPKVSLLHYGNRKPGHTTLKHVYNPKASRL